MPRHAPVTPALSPHLHRLGLALLTASAALAWTACGQPPGSGDPLGPWLPPLGPGGGPAVAAAGRLTAENYARERIPGPASQGLVGDYFLRNDKVRVVLQAPNRDIAPCPYGGNIIDADHVDTPAGDRLGEIAPFMQLGRTVDFRTVEILRDGSAGGPAVIRFRGRDALADYIHLTGIGGLTQAIADEYRASRDLGLEVAATYSLAPGASHVDATFTFYNPAAEPVETLFGTITDSGASLEIFHPTVGFGEVGFDTIFGGGTPITTEYLALTGPFSTPDALSPLATGALPIAYGLVPLFDGRTDVRSLPFPFAGVVIEAYEITSVGDLLGPTGQTLRIPPRVGVSRRFAFVVADDPGDVEQKVRALKGDPTVAVGGQVRVAGSARPAVGARVAVADATGTLVTVMVADREGRFRGALRPGTYRLQAEGAGWLRSPIATLTVGGTDNAGPATQDLEIPVGARLDYKVHDRAGRGLPAKITVIGPQDAPTIPARERRFRDGIKDSLPLGIAAWLASREGDSQLGTAWDHPIVLAPGRYRVVVGRGPEWSRVEQVVDLRAPGSTATVDVTLDRVLETPGYVACDFHQHTFMSPDAVAAPADRVVTYLADGLEFFASTEHDVHFDFRPVIEKLDARALIDTTVGVEITPFAYGHFIAFPLPVDPLSPSGGALDWAEAPMTGLNLTPHEVFAGVRGLGARVVQVSHPRSPIGTNALGTFQQNFDRAGLSFDFATRSFGGSVREQPLKAVELGLPAGADVFSPDFDTVEVYNGVSMRLEDASGERIDPTTETNMRDWMNFLSFGFTPTALGNSDAHEWVKQPAGLPRNMVRVPDDSSGALAAGLTDEVVRTVVGEGGAPRDVIVTNTPVIDLRVGGAGVGSTATHAGGPLAIRIRVQTPSWAPLDTVEVFANETFDVPPPKNQKPGPLAPALCFTSRGAPTMRCAQAAGGARPITWKRIEVAPGAARWEATVEAMVDPSALLGRQRAGARGQDLWLVARATGDVGLFPTIPTGILDPADVTRLVEKGTGPEVLAGRGIPALAFTNPVFVDVDGGGWRAPFAP